MSDGIGKVYDAFISYRHSELDDFVAEQLHKELEAFRVPNRIVKEKNLKKQKIERVFRDKEELPLASDLTDPLIIALKNSEFLIVICTPRLPESQWCRKEIETFMRFHGRERILLVLAEGEPEESFPDILCRKERTVTDGFGLPFTFTEQVDPLAADVRGKDEKEIKKKIKQEVLRLAAVMFGCDYDDLKERHRERALKRYFRILAGISVVIFGFGCFSSYQAQKIKTQYIETKKAQSEIMASVAKEKLEAGERVESIECALAALPDNLQNPEYPINYNAVSTLAEALRVYDNGTCLKADAFLEQEAAIEYMMEVENGRLLTMDMYGTLNIWDLENKKILATYDTAEFYSDFKNEMCMVAEDVLIYFDRESLNAVKVTEQKTLWSIPFEESGKVIYNESKDKLIAVSNNVIYEIDEKNGKVSQENPISWKVEDIYNISSLLVTKDGNYYYLAGNGGGTESCIAMVDAASLVKVNETTYPADGLYSMKDGGDTIALISNKNLGNRDSGSLLMEYKILALDSKTLQPKWDYKSDNYIDKVGQLDSGTWLAIGSNSLKTLNATTGEVMEVADFDVDILNVYMLDTGSLMLLMKDGSIRYQEANSFNFINYAAYNKIVDDWLQEFYSIGNNYITLKYGEKKMLLYNKIPKESMEVTDYVKEELLENRKDVNEFGYKEAVYKKEKMKAICNLEEEKLEFVGIENKVLYDTYDCKVKYLKQIGFTEDGSFLILQYQDDLVEVLDRSDFSIKATYESMEELVSSEDIDENYFVLRGVNEGYIMKKSTLELIAVVEGYVSYEEESNSFLIYNSQNEICRVPFYSVEELVEMAK